MSEKKKLLIRPARVMKLPLRKPKQMVVGIDEVGRGAFAGPVSVGTLYIEQTRLVAMAKAGKFEGLRDSKKLKPAIRAIWFAKIKQWKKEGLLNFCVVNRAANKVDRDGLTKAIQYCLNSGLKKLRVDKMAKILLDGGLYAPKEFMNQQTIIKGDEKEIVIALASITAKETRDTLMKKLSGKFPTYGFDLHVGYGTKKHIDAIKSGGICVEHRKLFLRKLNAKT